MTAWGHFRQINRPLPLAACPLLSDRVRNRPGSCPATDGSSQKGSLVPRAARQPRLSSCQLVNLSSLILAVCNQRPLAPHDAFDGGKDPRNRQAVAEKQLPQNHLSGHTSAHERSRDKPGHDADAGRSSHPALVDRRTCVALKALAQIGD